MLNKIILQGRLTKDPETKSTRNGSTLATFSIAVDRDFQPGGSEKRTDFFDCTVWNTSKAGFVERNFRKGQLVCLIGRMESRKWLDKSGSARLAWDVQVEDVWFCGDRQERSAVDAPPPDMEELPDGEGGELPF